MKRAGEQAEVAVHVLDGEGGPAPERARPASNEPEPDRGREEASASDPGGAAAYHVT